ncbi:hypothetical protein HPB48_000521 [Haemaphysalis longicornis]|uniref:Uncharacterized protein n=1 Tax=Haemaphysalis longicornis TaxID=44386 RepID=A0A9J6H581_HAELO|nr:hypothetical protein HPB48_000521 [Haemaphysalis longicornis]
MDELANFSKALSEKAPGFIKELAKVFGEMTAKILDAVASLGADIKKVAASNSTITYELATVKESMGFINECFEGFKAEIKTLWQEVTEATNRSLGSQKECERLERELRDTKREIIALKQYSRRNNIQLKGVLLTEEENVADIVRKVATFLKVELTGQDVDAAHRVPTKGSRPPNIVVKFVAKQDTKTHQRVRRIDPGVFYETFAARVPPDYSDDSDLDSSSYEEPENAASGGTTRLVLCVSKSIFV